MRHVIVLGLVAIASFAVTVVHADTLRKESFEGCTESEYSLLYGSFGGDANDGIQCGSQVGPRAFPFSFGSTVTGQDGEDYIGLEDLVGFGAPNPNAVVLSDIDIAGYSNLGINILFAAPAAGTGRYEASDYLEVQYRVDEGSWVTVGRFVGAGPGNVGMRHDVDLDGSTLTSVTNAMLRFTYPLNNRAGQGAVSGSTLSVRIAFSSDGAQEEMAFDDIVVTGDLAAPTMSFSSATYSVAEDGTPSGAAVVVERGGSLVGATDINVTFSAGSALGGGIDFNSSTILVSFADGETSKTVPLPIIDDSQVDPDETFTIQLATNGSNAVLGTTTSATVTILDNDAAAVSVSSASASVSEDGATDSYTVTLTSQPAGPVEVEITSISGELELSTDGQPPSSSVTLLFTFANWNVPQTVSVSAIDDADVESNPHNDTLTHVVASLDPTYDGVTVSDVAVTIADNDTCGDGVCNPTEDTTSCPADCTVCGDGSITGSEVCDGANLAGSSCAAQGFDYGTLACSDDCSAFKTLGCSLNICGDGVLFGTEQCDDGASNSNVTPNACRVNCTLPYCGDGVIDTGEACDGAALGGLACASFGYTSGTLSCTASCTLDVSQCELELPESDAGVDGGVDSGTDSDFSSETTTEVTSDTFVSTSEALDSSPSTDVEDTSGTTPATGAETSSISETTAVSSETTAPGGGVTSDDVSTSAAQSTSSAGPNPSTGVAPTSDRPMTSEGSATIDDVPSTDPAPSSESPSTTEFDETSTFGSSETTIEVTLPDIIGPITSNSDSTDTRSEPTRPSVVTPIYDAGLDGGADAGDGGTRNESCDCRVGARSSSSTGWFGLLLTGLIVARLSQRREGRTSVK